MSSNDLAISIRSVGKSYTISQGEEKHTTLAEAVAARLRNPFGKAPSKTFWALQDISMDIHRGDRFRRMCKWLLPHHRRPDTLPRNRLARRLRGIRQVGGISQHHLDHPLTLARTSSVS